MDQKTITSQYARKSCSATETKYMYKIVILFTVDQIFAYPKMEPVSYPLSGK